MEAESVWWSLGPMGAALVLYGLLSGTEMTLLTAQKSRLQQWKDTRRRGAATACLICETLESSLLTVRIGMVSMGVLAAVLTGAFAIRIVAPWLQVRPLIAHLGSWNETLALTLVLGGLTYIILVFGQLLPRAIAQQHPESFLCLVAWPFMVLIRLCRGLRTVVTASSRVV